MTARTLEIAPIANVGELLDRATERLERARLHYGHGTDNPRDAMQGYLDWEFGLIAQLERDGTHGFRVA